MKIENCHQRDVTDVESALLENGLKRASEALSALPATIQQQLVGGAFSVCEHRRLHGRGPEPCLLKKLRVQLGLTYEELSRDVNYHYSRAHARICQDMQDAAAARWTARARPEDVKLFKQGMIHPDSIRVEKPERIEIPASSLRNWEQTRPPAETIRREARMPIEFFFGLSFDSLMGRELPKTNSNERKDFHASPAGRLLAVSRAELGDVAGENLPPREAAHA